MAQYPVHRDAVPRPRDLVLVWSRALTTQPWGLALLGRIRVAIVGFRARRFLPGATPHQTANRVVVHGDIVTGCSGSPQEFEPAVEILSAVRSP